jgi:hypothetical protein
MGGLQGRSVAAQLPQVVRHVIALGSPLAMAREQLRGGVRMTAIYSPKTGSCDTRRRLRAIRAPRT